MEVEVKMDKSPNAKTGLLRKGTSISQNKSLFDIENDDELEELENLKKKFKTSTVRLTTANRSSYSSGLKTILVAFQFSNDENSNKSNNYENQNS
jgi:hypothetical protein